MSEHTCNCGKSHDENSNSENGLNIDVICSKCGRPKGWKHKANSSLAIKTDKEYDSGCGCGGSGCGCSD